VIDREIELPAGYFIKWGGQFPLQKEANKRLAVVIPVTLPTISLLLYSSFGSVDKTYQSLLQSVLSPCLV